MSSTDCLSSELMGPLHRQCHFKGCFLKAFPVCEFSPQAPGSCAASRCPYSEAAESTPALPALSSGEFS